MSKPEAVMEAKDSFKGSAGVDMEVLMKELGQARRFHLCNYVLLALSVFVAALYGTNYVFLAADVSYRYTLLSRMIATHGYPCTFRVSLRRAVRGNSGNYTIDHIDLKIKRFDMRLGARTIFIYLKWFWIFPCRIFSLSNR